MRAGAVTPPAAKCAYCLLRHLPHDTWELLGRKLSSGQRGIAKRANRANKGITRTGARACVGHILSAELLLLLVLPCLAVADALRVRVPQILLVLIVLSAWR